MIDITEIFKKALEFSKSVIRKDGPSDTPWCIYSKKGKKMGCFSSEKKAKERLSEIDFFSKKNNE